MGVKNAIQTPRLAAKINPIQPRRTGTVGSASAAGSDAGCRVEGGHRADPGREAAITSRSQVYDDFGVRLWVA